MVVGAPDPKEGEVGMTSSAPKNVDDTYSDDDWFDLDKYKQAAQVAYDFSIGKNERGG